MKLCLMMNLIIYFSIIDLNVFLNKHGQTWWGLTFPINYMHYIMVWREYYHVVVRQENLQESV